jgi:hypothetical protein
VALDKSVAPSHLPTMAGATPTQLLVKVRRGRRTMIETPVLLMVVVLAIGAIVWWLYA